MKLVDAQRDDDQEGKGAQPASQVSDDLQAQLVAPVQVLQRQQRRPVVGQGGQPLHRIQHQEPTSSVCVARIG